MSKTVNIEIVSDFACPWCLIGMRRLKRAIEQRPELDFTLNWLPFQLNPDMPREGSNRRDYYHNKFGELGTRKLRETLKNTGAEEGIVFCNEPDAVAPNTLSAHVLMHWAAEDENIDIDMLAEQIFHAHHVACENIGDHDVLTGIAGEAGMDKVSVMSKLAAGEGEDWVKQQIHQSAARGVSSVPFFIMNGQHGISGAQSAESLALAFDQIANAED